MKIQNKAKAEDCCTTEQKMNEGVEQHSDGDGHNHEHSDKGSFQMFFLLSFHFHF